MSLMRLSRLLLLAPFCLLNSPTSAAAEVRSDQLSAADEAPLTVEWDTSLDEGFFSSKSLSARLVLGSYDLNQGLYAGYQATNGVRMLIRAGYLPNGRMHLRVRSSASARHAPDASIAVSSDPARPVTVVVGDVDLLTLLDPETRDSRQADKDRRALRRYLSRRDGEALVELVPALYAALEEQIEEGNRQYAALRRPLGVMRMLLDLASAQKSGFPNHASLLGSQRSSNARSDCRGRCALRGRSYVIHNDGLFDIIADGAAVAGKSALPQSSSDGQCAGNAGAFPLGRAKDYVDDYFNNLPPEEQDRMRRECWGDCGAGCSWGFTIESCRQHDYCVARNGHMACSHDAPDGDSLMEAIWDVTRYLMGFGEGTCTSDCGYGGPATGNWGDPFSDAAPWYCEGCYTPSQGGFCTFDVNCVDYSPTGG